MKAPDKIYLGLEDVGSGYTWNISILDNGMEQYIRKDALMEWANKMLQDTADRLDFRSNQAFAELYSKLNSM